MSVPFVVDASVVAKWFDQDEEDAAPALRYLELLFKKENDFIEPDLIFYELGNVFWKKWKSSYAQMERGLNELWRLPWFLMPLRPSLLSRSAEIASRCDITFYDSLYVATAERNDALLITADRKLLNKIQRFPFAKHLLES